MSNERYLFKKKALSCGNNTCFYCGKSCVQDEIHIDHYLPRSKGGSNNKHNLRVSCVRCNQLKRALSPVEFVAFVQAKHLKSEEEVNYYMQILARREIWEEKGSDVL